MLDSIKYPSIINFNSPISPISPLSSGNGEGLNSIFSNPVDERNVAKPDAWQKFSQGLVNGVPNSNGSIFGNPVKQENKNSSGDNDKNFLDPTSGNLVNQKQGTELNTQRTGEYEQSIEKNNEGIRLHEEAHQTESGPQASGGPVVNFGSTDKDGRKIATDGHQMINIPEKATPQQSIQMIDKAIQAAKFVIKGALAPLNAGVPAPHNQLSDADKSVANKGQSILSASQAAKQQRMQLEQSGKVKPEEENAPEPKTTGGDSKQEPQNADCFSKMVIA
jgi:hypothetical protein